MNCPSCGQENRKSARFCDGCGASFAPPAKEMPVPSEDFVPSSGFIGRQQEIGRLKGALEDGLAGQGQLVLLAGEPGIGKTPTAQELAGHAERMGALVLWGRCYDGEGAPPYWPWTQVIRSYFQWNDSRPKWERGLPTSRRLFPN